MAYTPFPTPRHERNRPAIIGLAGYARSGKDSVAARLVEAYGFTRFAFADALKRAALALNPMVDSYHRLSHVVNEEGWESAKSHGEVRRVLQHFGMGIRDIDPDFWVRIVLDQFYARENGAVITDVRFPNEAERIRNIGGIIVRVVRPGVGPVNGHASETALDDLRPEWTINNDGDLDALARAVDAWYRKEIAA